MKIGDKVSGTISGIQPYGVFVNLDNGEQGLIHISELKHGFVSNIDNNYMVGDKVNVVVMGIDEYNGKISLSIRALEQRKVGRPILHKHFWTDYKNKIGYKTIENQKGQWINEAITAILKEKQKK
ncbi:CvfD/Ygs/GSP13 family RNA-binding post-transcriptional regulator [Companilactobacillus jidongensis]|uniref:CvfD/Ygs/GSP13 family RNA-binding post-transcriptional regulator n=1 Tax=Companilactobacillus jidongensis TaxID=2486006 RepID=UPI000F792D4D|nr:CvfD/Ygs/GSP13 family RNA-binding post-transcriptional regulator [Companilactobacillus jidongensis]